MFIEFEQQCNCDECIIQGEGKAQTWPIALDIKRIIAVGPAFYPGPEEQKKRNLNASSLGVESGIATIFYEVLGTFEEITQKLEAAQWHTLRLKSF